MKKKSLLLALCAVFLAACNNTMTPTTETMDTTTTTETEDTSMMMPEPTPMTDTYTLSEQNESGQTGTFTLTENAAGGVTAVLSLTGGDFTEPQPAHIHVGECPTPGAVQYPLTNVVDGESTTEIDATFAEIMASSPRLAVNVHKSAAESNVYTACANIQ
jgi:hypothetical protein